jgi:hypothetical protein
MGVRKRGGDEEWEFRSCGLHTVCVTRPYVATRVCTAKRYVDDHVFVEKGKG